MLVIKSLIADEFHFGAHILLDIRKIRKQLQMTCCAFMVISNIGANVVDVQEANNSFSHQL